MGVVMMTGIMAIFEMGLSLTGQSLLPAPPSGYPQNSLNKVKDAQLMKSLSTQAFDDSVLANGLCVALQGVDGEPWSLIENLEPDNYFFGSCGLSREGLERSIVRKNDDEDMPYQLFSCALDAGKSKCSFEES